MVGVIAALISAPILLLVSWIFVLEYTIENSVVAGALAFVVSTLLYAFSFDLSECEALKEEWRIQAENEYMKELNLRKFLQHLGFDPEKISELDMRELEICNHLAINSLQISRDYSQSGFSEQGIAASNKYLDSLMLTESRK